MTRNYYVTEYMKPDHSTFGGKIYESDFDGYTSISSIASRILSDRRFDNQCKRCMNNNRKKGENKWIDWNMKNTKTQIMY